MPPPPESLAASIVRLLFTNASGDLARRLVLEGGAGEDLGGWSLEGACSAIADLLPIDAPQVIELDAPVKDYICRRCGRVLGQIVEMHRGGKMVKGFYPREVIWMPNNFGYCKLCGARVYFRGDAK